MKLIFKIIRSKENFILALGGIFAVILVWFVVTSAKIVEPIFLSSPIDVYWEFIAFFRDGSILPDLRVSAIEFSIGFLSALFFGILLGFLLGWFRKAKAISTPLVFALYSTPTIAIIPLIILWFGFGLSAKVIIVFLASFFPILISIMEAVKNTDPQLLRLAKSFTATNLQTLTKIVIPNSIPNIISGIKIALPRGIIGMIVGEFYTGSAGLGYLISYYGATFQTARLLAVVILIMIISVSLTIFINFFEKKLRFN